MKPFRCCKVLRRTWHYGLTSLETSSSRVMNAQGVLLVLGLRHQRL